MYWSFNLFYYKYYFACTLYDRASGIATGTDRASGIATGTDRASGIATGTDRDSGIATGTDRVDLKADVCAGADEAAEGRVRVRVGQQLRQWHGYSEGGA